MSSVINRFYEFENFRLDAARRLLARDGKLVPLKPKVFDTLLALVASGGELIEKEDLLKQVWGGAAIEEVGLAKNISTLRKALGESPGEHRYIVTVPGRGYRFVAPVAIVSADAPQFERTATEEDEREQATLETETVPGGRRSSRFAIPIGALLVVGIGIAHFLNLGPALTDQDTILLADFVNRTGEAVFDETLQQGLAVQLDQSPLLNIFPDAQVRRTLIRMNRSPDEPVTEAIAREICQRQGLKAFIAGSIAPIGSHYAITLEAFDGQSGTTLARTQLEAETKEQVLRTLSKAASELRQSLGESLASIKRFDALLERTTPSLAALQAYSLGRHETRRGKSREALPFYRRAIELDPNFAYAYTALAVHYRNSRQPGLAAEYAAKAYGLRDRVAETEALYITSLYHELVTGDIGRNIEALKLHARITPRNPGPHNNLAVAYVTIGQFEQAVEEGQIALRLDPTSSIRYGMLGNALVRLSRFDDARRLYRRAQEQQFDSLSMRRGLFRIAFVEQDQTEMERQLSWAAAHSNEHAGLDWQARAAAYSGQWRRSLEHTRRAIDSATLNEEPEVAAEYAAESALRGTALDQCAATKTLASQAISIKRNPVSLTRAGLALALCGDTGEAQSMIDELRKRYPQHTIVNWIWLPMIQAAIELKQAHDESAVELLKLVQRYEAAAEFWPQYLRGQAYLHLGKESEAAAEFTKILEHRGHDVQSVLYPLAHLRLARVSILKRDVANARNSYGQFLILWKNADPELPMVTEAKKGVEAK